MATLHQPLATRVMLLVMSTVLGVAAIVIVGWIGFVFAVAYGWPGIGLFAGLLLGVAGLIAWWASHGRRLR